MSSLLDLKRMRYFVVVAEELHFRRAALRLGISQPPLSQQIQALEADLGLQLFERNRQRVYLTPVGHHLLERSRKILADVEATRQELLSADASFGGTLIRIGFTPASSLMPFLKNGVQGFRGQFPHIEITMQEMQSVRQIEALLKREIDIGLIRNPPVSWSEGMTFERITSDALVVAVHENHPLAAKRAIRVTDLKDEPLISYAREAGMSLYQEIYKLAMAAGFYPETVHEARDSSTIIGLVAAGAGVAVVPVGLRAISVEGVKYIKIVDDGAKAEIQAVHRSDNSSALVAAIRRQFAAHAGSQMV